MRISVAPKRIVHFFLIGLPSDNEIFLRQEKRLKELNINYKLFTQSAMDSLNLPIGHWLSQCKM